MRWACAVTSVVSRKDTLLPQTLKSLQKAGFPEPDVYIDDAYGGVDCVCRGPQVGEYANWMLALAKMALCDPNADRYAVFQDDFIMYPKTREYLDRCRFPEQGYWNLFTFLENEEIVAGKPCGWYESAILEGYETYQTGRGAVALVFDRKGVESLLSHRGMWARAKGRSGRTNTDGAVCRAMNDMGFREYIHNPSLVQHEGYPSTVYRTAQDGSTYHMEMPKSNAWLGEDFDLLSIPQQVLTHTVADIVDRYPSRREKPIPAPEYTPKESACHWHVGLCVPSMRHHMTNEGWEIFRGLKDGGGYRLSAFKKGYAEFVELGLSCDMTDVAKILRTLDPATLVIQDHREWDKGTTPHFDERERFTNVSALRERDDVFKVTILKDAQNNNKYHRAAAEEIGAHAWIVYYHPDIVAKVAPFVRREHLIRTYHSVDPAVVPAFNDGERMPCLLSGAISNAYPLRRRLAEAVCQGRLPSVQYLTHPGYHANGTETPSFLQTLSQFKVAICTASVFGYALRKIVEATAAGCIVVTDLPEDEILPEIDGNLVRVHPQDTVEKIAALVDELAASWDAVTQCEYAARATQFYDYKEVGRRLAEDIERMRVSYPCTP